MDKLKWIVSAGGPLILISDKTISRWSGILNRSAYLKKEEEDADDFLDPDEADYGKACQVDGYVGLIKLDDEEVLVLGSEPMFTTFFFSHGKPVLARWFNGEDEAFVDHALLNIDLGLMLNWEFELRFNLVSDTPFLFDSACSESMLNNQQRDYLRLNMKAGYYEVSTSVYEPDDKTKLILHKFEMIK